MNLSFILNILSGLLFSTIYSIYKDHHPNRIYMKIIRRIQLSGSIVQYRFSKDKNVCYQCDASIVINICVIEVGQYCINEVQRELAARDLIKRFEKKTTFDINQSELEKISYLECKSMKQTFPLGLYRDEVIIDPTKLFVFFNGNFKPYILTSALFNQDNFGSNDFYLSYFTIIYPNLHIGQTRGVEMFGDYTNLAGAYLLLELKYNCMDSYVPNYQCMLQCVEGERNTCNNGKQSCRIGWRSVTVEVYLQSYDCGNRDLIIFYQDQCLYFNPCDHKVCREGVCVPTYNASYECVNVNPLFTTSLYEFYNKSEDFNVTYEYIDKIEKIKISLYNLSEVIMNYSFIKWNAVHRNYSKYIFINDDILEINAEIPVGYEFYISYTLLIMIDIIHYIVIRKFIIVENPYPPILESDDEVFMYWGEIVRCVTSASPSSGLSYQWELLNKSIIFHHPISKDNSLLIDHFLYPSLTILKCNVFFELKNKPKFTISRVFYRIIRSYKFLYWVSKNKDIYNINDSIQCEKESLSISFITLYQEAGPRNIKIETRFNFITLNPSPLFGNYYSFICRLEFALSNIMFEKQLTVTMNYPPTKICTTAFIPVRGILIGCLNDGQEHDQTKTVIYIIEHYYDFNMIRGVVQSEYARIPYLVKYPLYSLLCNVTYTRMNLTETCMSKTIQFELLNLTGTSFYNENESDCGHISFNTENTVTVNYDGKLLFWTMDHYLQIFPNVQLYVLHVILWLVLLPGLFSIIIMITFYYAQMIYHSSQKRLILTMGRKILLRRVTTYFDETVKNLFWFQNMQKYNRRRFADVCHENYVIDRLRKAIFLEEYGHLLRKKCCRLKKHKQYRLLRLFSLDRRDIKKNINELNQAFDVLITSSSKIDLSL